MVKKNELVSIVLLIKKWRVEASQALTIKTALAVGDDEVDGPDQDDGGAVPQPKAAPEGAPHVHR